MHSSHPTSTTYYTTYTIFQCPSPSSSTRHTSQRNEGRREGTKDEENKGTKTSTNERRRLTYNTIQSSWNHDELPSFVLKTTCFTMKNLFWIQWRWSQVSNTQRRKREGWRYTSKTIITSMKKFEYTLMLMVMWLTWFLLCLSYMKQYTNFFFSSLLLSFFRLPLVCVHHRQDNRNDDTR